MLYNWANNKSIEEIVMLTNLHIKNLALIDEVRVNFSKGFNVFTGETGAGKSILISSLGLLLGGKADKSLIKGGCQFAKVDAMFDVEGDTDVFSRLFDEIGVDREDTISLSRTINISGKSEYRVNGEIVTLNVFKKFASELLDVFGQHDNQELLDRHNHILFLDKYIGNNVLQLKSVLAEQISELNAINRKISALGGDERQREREVDLLNFEINQIEEANLRLGEDEELIGKRTILQNSEKISRVMNEVVDKILGINNIPMTLKDVVSQLGSITGLDKDIDQCRERTQSVRWEIEDIAGTLQAYAQSINYDENELNKIEERLDLINGYKRKFGNTIEEILAYYDQCVAKREALLNCDKELQELNEAKNKLLIEILDVSNKLHNLRINNKSKLEQEIETELKELGMKNAKFVIDIAGVSDIASVEKNINTNGLDVVEFLFSANLGVDVRPLDKIISGGELSRFSLAFKTIVNTDSNNKTLIFDEIDTGIGGNTGSVVGKKIAKISKHNQVLCITHLAQIASFGDSHYKIVKTEDDAHTYTTIYYLNEEERVSEIARMIGSISNNNFANLHSIELIAESNKYKESI